MTTKTVGIISVFDKLKYYNFLILSNALLRNGFKPIAILSNSISVASGDFFALTKEIDKEIKVGENITNFTKNRIDNLDYLWNFQFGGEATYLDNLDFLFFLENFKGIRFVNSAISQLYWNNKFIPSFIPGIITPKTIISNDVDEIYDLVLSSEKTFIIKPPADSQGRNVLLLSAKDSNLKQLIEISIKRKLKKYVVVQEYVEKIRTKGEKRVLLANGNIIGSYCRQTNGLDHRTNLATGAKAVVGELSQEEVEYCLNLAKYLKGNGILWAGVDLVYPYVIEINVVNPGGLNTIFYLTGEDKSDRVIEAIFGS